jgi:hypothetical protein
MQEVSRMAGLDRKGQHYYSHAHRVSTATMQTLGWSGIILGVLIILNIALGWSPALEYLWGALAIIVGIWTLGAG